MIKVLVVVSGLAGLLVLREGWSAAFYAVPMAYMFLHGAVIWGRNEQSFSARWTGEGELLSWRRDRSNVTKEGSIAWLLSFDQGLSMFGFLALPFFFALAGIERQNLLSLLFASLIPALGAGQLLRKHLNRGGVTRWVSVLEAGIVTTGVLFRWEQIGGYSLDPSSDFIRLKSAAPGQLVLEALLPPREVRAQFIEILQDHNITELPWAEDPRALYLIGGLLALKALLLTVFVLLPNRDLACVMSGTTAWVMGRISLAVINRAVGFRVPEPGTDLQRAN